MFEIKIEGLEQMVGKLDKFAADFPKFIADAMLQTVLFTQGKLPSYPPPPPASTYRRTGTLGRSITTLAGSDPYALSTVKPLGGEVQGIIGTKLSYAPYVIDEERQAEAHKGRWWTLQGVVRGLQDTIVKFFQDQVSAFVHKYL
jgi:hypothetical protein